MRLLPPLHPDRRSSQEQIHPPPSYGWALGREWRRLLSRPRDFALATWLPLLAMAVLGTLVCDLPPSELRVVAVDQDTSNASRQLLRQLDAGPELRVSLYDDADRARAEVSAGRAQAVLVVPAGFARQLGAGAATSVVGHISPAGGPPGPSDAGASPVALPGAGSDTSGAAFAAMDGRSAASPNATPSAAIDRLPLFAPDSATPPVTLDIRLAPQSRSADARVLQHVRVVLDHVAADVHGRASPRPRAAPPGSAGAAPRLPGAGAARGPDATAAAALPLSPSRAATALPEPTPRSGHLALHVDAPALQARGDALVVGSAALLTLLQLLAAMLIASLVGREFKERSAYQWLAGSGRSWRVALAAKLTLPASLVSAQALLALLLWQGLAPAPLQGSLWMVAAALLLSQFAGLGLGLLLCGLLPSLRSTLALLGLLTPLVLVMLQHAAVGSPWWAELLPLVHVLRVVDHAWWLPSSLGMDWTALRELGLLVAQASMLVALGGWLLSRRAFLPGLMRQA